MARKPMNAAQRKASGERLAAGRAAARGRKSPDPGASPRHVAPPLNEPAFMRDGAQGPAATAGTAPQPQARASDARVSPEAQEAARLTIENEMAAVYAGAHFVPAFVLGIPELQVDEDTAREMSKRFLRMMAAWGIQLDGAATGKIMATLNFGMMFLTVELTKINVARNVINARMAQAEAASRAAAEPAPEPLHNSPGLMPDVAMGGFAAAAE